MSNPTFCKEPEIKLSDWTEGYQWGLLGKKILKYKKDDKSLFCFAAGTNISINTVCESFFYISNEPLFSNELMECLLSFIFFNHTTFREFTNSCNRRSQLWFR